MATTTARKLEVRTMVPAFELMSAEGQAVNLWQFKQQKNLVLVFIPDVDCEGCAEFLDRMIRDYHEYEDEQTVALVILRGDTDAAVDLRNRLHPPFQILCDPDGHVTEQYTSMLPAVFVADLFGELKAEWQDRFPSRKDILDVVELINLECPECGAPVDWA